MPRIEQDRTGEVCPSCHEGKLYPTGKGGWKQNQGVSSGELGSSDKQYVCDKCGKLADAVGMHLGGNISASAIMKATNPEDKNN